MNIHSYLKWVYFAATLTVVIIALADYGLRAAIMVMLAVTTFFLAHWENAADIMERTRAQQFQTDESEDTGHDEG